MTGVFNSRRETWEVLWGLKKPWNHPHESPYRQFSFSRLSRAPITSKLCLRNGTNVKGLSFLANEATWFVWSTHVPAQLVLASPYLSSASSSQSWKELCASAIQPPPGCFA